MAALYSRLAQIMWPNIIKGQKYPEIKKKTSENLNITVIQNVSTQSPLPVSGQIYNKDTSGGDHKNFQTKIIKFTEI